MPEAHGKRTLFLLLFNVSAYASQSKKTLSEKLSDYYF